MTNFEKYKDRTKEILEEGDYILFGLTKDNMPTNCDKLDCSACKFGREISCNYARLKWLFEEAETSEETPKDIETSSSGLWLTREYLQGGVIDKQFACSSCDYTSGHVMTNWKYCPVCGSRNFSSLKELKGE